MAHISGCVFSCLSATHLYWCLFVRLNQFVKGNLQLILRKLTPRIRSSWVLNAARSALLVCVSVGHARIGITELVCGPAYRFSAQSVLYQQPAFIEQYSTLLKFFSSASGFLRVKLSSFDSTYVQYELTMIARFSVSACY